MASKRQTQIAEMMAHRAGDFFARESNRESLITVTRADVSPDLKNVKIYALYLLLPFYSFKNTHFPKRIFLFQHFLQHKHFIFSFILTTQE